MEGAGDLTQHSCMRATVLLRCVFVQLSGFTPLTFSRGDGDTFSWSNLNCARATTNFTVRLRWTRRKTYCVCVADRFQTWQLQGHQSCEKVTGSSNRIRRSRMTFKCFDAVKKNVLFLSHIHSGWSSRLIGPEWTGWNSVTGSSKCLLKNSSLLLSVLTNLLWCNSCFAQQLKLTDIFVSCGWAAH